MGSSSSSPLTTTPPATGATGTSGAASGAATGLGTTVMSNLSKVSPALLLIITVVSVVGIGYAVTRTSAFSPGDYAGVVITAVAVIGLILYNKIESPAVGTDSTPAQNFKEGISSLFSKLTAPSPGEQYQESFMTAITVPFMILIYFLPYFVGFFAIFNDIVAGTFSLSVGVILAAILNLINLVIGKYITNPPRLNDLCGLPGLSFLNSGFIPQAPLFVSTAMAYIATFTTIVHGSGTNTARASWALWGAFAITQYTILLKNSTTCLDLLQFGKWSPLLSILIGLGAGGVVGTYGTKFVASSTGASPSLGTSSGSPFASPAPSSTPSVGTCSAPNDQDQFVCETYKDGKLVTSTVASS